MSFDPEKRKQQLIIIRTLGVLMAIGFMVLGIYLEQFGPLIGFSSSFSNSVIAKYLFIAMGILDLIIFTFIFK